jgi:cellulose synthase (UDP-forming)
MSVESVVPDSLQAQSATAPVRVLPTPPDDNEVRLYQHREFGVIVGVSLVSILCLTISQVHFAEINPWLLLALPFLAFTMLYYLISLVIGLGGRNFDFDAHQTLIEQWAPTTYPTVDILLPICNEGLDVLVNTWTHVAALAEHYRGEVNVLVLDDGDSAAAAAAVREFGFTYTVRPNRGWFKKAGNLRHGYELTHREFIAIFDADFCPRPDFLDHLLPYHDADPGLGIVQSPQFFRHDARQTWVERGAGAVQELFYRMVQVSRDRRNGAICVGSCAVYRRAALDNIGGTTLIEHSEDVHTGFDLFQAGWRLRYLPVVLATGLCPADPDSFLTQQYRWCAGSMSLLASRKFWSTKLPVGMRLCYLSGFFYYIHTAVFVLVTPAIPVVLIFAEPQRVLLANCLWILPSTLYMLVVFPLWNRIRYGPTALMAKYLYSWAHLFAITDMLRHRRMGWQVTGGAGAKSSTGRIWLAIGLWGTAASGVWIIGAVSRGVQLGFANWVFLDFTGLLYASILAMALWSRRQSTARE